MNIKTILLVIILAIIIGVSIVYLPKALNQKPAISQQEATLPKNSLGPAATPIATKPPVLINESSDLKQEIDKIQIPEFSSEIEQLKKELK